MKDSIPDRMESCFYVLLPVTIVALCFPTILFLNYKSVKSGERWREEEERNTDMNKSIVRGEEGEYLRN